MKWKKEAENRVSFSYLIVLLDYYNVIVLNSVFCLNCDWVLIISLWGKIVSSVHKILFVISGITALHRRSFYRVLSHKFYRNFFKDIAYLSLYQEYRYIEDRYSGVPLYKNYILFKYFERRGPSSSGSYQKWL